MTDIVKQINDALEARVAAKIGTSYKELAFKLNVAANAWSGSNKNYGVIPKEAVSINTITNSYTADQPFEVILTHGYVNNQNDKEQIAKQFILYEKIDLIIKDLLPSKLGLNSIVLKTGPFTIQETEFIDDSIVVQRLQLTVQYRQPT